MKCYLSVIQASPFYRLVGLVVKASTSRVEDHGFKSLALGFYQGRVIPMTKKLALQWLPCQVPGVIGSVLGLVSPVSVYCDWVRWKVRPATSTSVWQHVKLSEQVRPWDTLVCCWDVKQTTTLPSVYSSPSHLFNNICLWLHRVPIREKYDSLHLIVRLMINSGLSPHRMVTNSQLCHTRPVNHLPDQFRFSVFKLWRENQKYKYTAEATIISEYVFSFNS